jgi:hypothetical protein
MFVYQARTIPSAVLTLAVIEDAPAAVAQGRQAAGWRWCWCCCAGGCGGCLPLRLLWLLWVKRLTKNAHLVYQHGWSG